MFKTLDDLAIHLCAQIAHHSIILDKFIVGTLARPSYKLAPIIVCIWIIWFSGKDRVNGRRAAIKALTGGALALLLGRLIQTFHEKRPRPLHADHPGYVSPYGVDHEILKDWSSFPSDHAALAFAMSAGIMSFSPLLGIFCVLWSLFVVSLPRVYAGYHYASDIIGGMVLGVAVYFSMLCLRPVFDKLLAFAEKLEERYTGAFYGAAFFMSLQLATMFDDLRAPLSLLLKYLG